MPADADDAAPRSLPDERSEALHLPDVREDVAVWQFWTIIDKRYAFTWEQTVAVTFELPLHLEKNLRLEFEDLNTAVKEAALDAAGNVKEAALDTVTRKSNQLNAALDAGRKAYVEEKRRTESTSLLKGGPAYPEDDLGKQ